MIFVLDNIFSSVASFVAADVPVLSAAVSPF